MGVTSSASGQDVFSWSNTNLSAKVVRELLLDGIGSFYTNLVFADVETDRYRMLNLREDPASASYAHLLTGAYSKDNAVYAENFVAEDDRDIFLRYTSPEWCRENLTEKGMRHNFQMRRLYNGSDYRWVTLNTVCTRRDNEAFHVLYWIYDIQDTLLKDDEIDDSVLAAEFIGQFRWEHQDGIAPRLIMNDSYRRLTGLGFCKTPEEANREYFKRLDRSSWKEYSAYFNGLKQQPGTEGEEFTYKWEHPTLGMRYFRGKSTCVAATESFTCYKGYHQDITSIMLDKIDQQRKLEEALVAAEAASRAKTIFLSNMSHDIRTPMNAIVGFAELLEKYSDNAAKRKEYIAKIKDSSEFLLSLISDVLEMSRIETSTLGLNVQPASIQQISETVSAALSNQLEEKHLNFTQNVNVEHETVRCDAVKIGEVCLSILSNAIAYTPEGGSVTLDVTEAAAEKEGWAVYTIRIADTGIGMSKEYLPHLFESFTREQETEFGTVSGTGLGMAIAKQLVELMGGTIEAESEKGRGSTFTVTLTLEIAEGAQEQRIEAGSFGDMAHRLHESQSPAGGRVLIAEDNDLNAEIAAGVLEDAGFITERAVDGADCVQKVKKARSGHYAAVLMDLQMPNMNGYEAAAAIRKLEGARSEVPIIAITANAFDSYKQAAFDAGMNGFLTKPIDVNALLETLASL